MNNTIIFSVPDASTTFPSELLIFLVIVNNREEARRATGSSNVTSLGNHFDFVSNGNKIAVVLKDSSVADVIRCLTAMKTVKPTSKKMQGLSCGKNALSEDWTAKWRIDYYTDFDVDRKHRRAEDPFIWDSNDELSQSCIDEGGRISEMALGMNNVDRDAAEADWRYRSSVFSTPEYDDDNEDCRDLFDLDDAQ